MAFDTLEDVIAIEKASAWADLPLPKTLWGMLSETAQRVPNNPAFSFQLLSGPKDPAQTLSWSELQQSVAQAANMFRDMGVGEGDVVAMLMPNCTDTVQALLGGMVAGIILPINPLLEPSQIGALLNASGAKVLVTLKGFPKTDVPQKAAQALAYAPHCKTVLEVDLNRYLTFPKSVIVPLIRPKVAKVDGVTYHDFTAKMASYPRSLSFDDNAGDRVGAYFHTGGTTGMPKMVAHRYEGMIYNGYLGDELLFSDDDSVMCPLPLFHVFAVHVILMSMIKSGAHVVFPTPAGYRGDGVMDNFWKLCERWKTTFIVTVPTAIAALMQRPVDADISTVKNAFSGSAPMPLELYRRFKETSGVDVSEGYGLTEATCLVSCNPITGEKKIGSVGIRFPYCDIRIVNGAGDECAADEVGEICVSTPGVVPGGTYTDASKNEGLYWKDTHLRTGDLGRVDADGYLFITGRAKDLIIRGGHNIDPAQIEDALLEHPAVAFAGAIGQPDMKAGELPCAYVELVEGGEVTSDELMKICESGVHERAARPKHIEVMPELPKTAVGKIFKPDLRKMAIKRVYTKALCDEGLLSEVVDVIDDKQRGLTAKIAVKDGEDVGAVLGQFSQPWDAA